MARFSGRVYLISGGARGLGRALEVEPDTPHRAMPVSQRCHIIAVGAGFAGLCLLHRLRRSIELNSRMMDKIRALQEETGKFGTLLDAGVDWQDQTLARNSVDGGESVAAAQRLIVFTPRIDSRSHRPATGHSP